ncbi:MAG: C40 family peptidase [Anaerotignum sp.]|nr:C40 family peptidase [Anaerotignum sp.]
MTNRELVTFAKSKLGTAYVYGMKGDVLTEKKYEQLKILFGDLVWDSDRQKIGKVCVDCSGLISWATGIHRNSQGYHDTAAVVFPLSMLKEAPAGAALWCKGHIGIYLGDGKYIAADGSRYGVRIADVQESSFTHWFLLKDIVYKEEEMVTKEDIIYNDRTYTVEMIRKNGVTYLKTRDIAKILGLSVSSKGKIPVLKNKNGSAA